MVDIDYFKLYNDSYGHLAGDEALKQVALALTSTMQRKSDFTARYGGEEFVVFGVDMTIQQAFDMGKKLCSAVSALNIPHQSSVHHHVTISCGVAHVIPSSTSNPGVLLQEADQALYRAKANGRNQASLYSKLP